MSCDICIRPWDYQVAPFHILGNLYYVGNKGVSAHLIDSGEGLILIDTGYPQTVYLLLESIRRLRFDPDDIHYILHCHAHYDHIGGTRALVELTGAKVGLVRILAVRAIGIVGDLALSLRQDAYRVERFCASLGVGLQVGH